MPALFHINLLNVYTISVLKYSVLKIQIKSVLRCVRIKTNYTQDENCDMLLTLDGYDNRTVNDGTSTCNVILVKAIQTLMCFDNYSSVYARQNVVAHADSTDTGHSSCHHKCSSKITTVEKLM